MSYCTLDQALALLPSSGVLRDASEGVSASVPTLTQAMTMLEVIEAELAVHVAARPNIDEDAHAAYLQGVAMNGVAAKIAKAKWPAASGIDSATSVSETLRAEYVAQLEFIDGGGIDAAGNDDSAMTSIGHGFSDADGVAPTPISTRAREF